MTNITLPTRWHGNDDEWYCHKIPFCSTVKWADYHDSLRVYADMCRFIAHQTGMVFKVRINKADWQHQRAPKIMIGSGRIWLTNEPLSVWAGGYKYVSFWFIKTFGKGDNNILITPDQRAKMETLLCNWSKANGYDGIRDQWILSFYENGYPINALTRWQIKLLNQLWLHK